MRKILLFILSLMLFVLSLLTFSFCYKNNIASKMNSFSETNNSQTINTNNVDASLNDAQQHKNINHLKKHVKKIKIRDGSITKNSLVKLRGRKSSSSKSNRNRIIELFNKNIERNYKKLSEKIIINNKEWRKEFLDQLCKEGIKKPIFNKRYIKQIKKENAIQLWNIINNITKSSFLVVILIALTVSLLSATSSGTCFHYVLIFGLGFLLAKLYNRLIH